MLSFYERVKTFKNWPAEFKDFSKKLAVMGQFSVNSQTLTSACVFCKKEHKNWNILQTPLFTHLDENEDCPLYKLTRKPFRKLLIKNETENKAYLDGNYVQFDIFEKNLFFCLKCGSDDLKHTCGGRVQKITRNMDISTADFYVKYLSGEYLKEICAYLKGVLGGDKDNLIGGSNKTNALKMNVLSGLVKEFGKGTPFQKLGDYLKDCSELIYDSIEKRIKSIEKDAFESLNNESVLY
jgi:hypothetical protein